ncbi:alginate lyase family protein [uncultured Lacinutrix sp.]|uniref:alginate lyase family protein n=1 Tax=uncultured Lacinutrix sp. TaxID=574032 RepID=UPI00261777DA|nr:alginate lyase family protein [uncultured Lacinutrix sp.]
MNIKTILSKPIPVVWYRFKQLLKLKYYYKTQFWSKIETQIANKVSRTEICISKSNLFHDGFKGYNESTLELNNTTIENANRILEGKIFVFDVEYKFTFPLQWNVDWRANETWDNKYFKGYSFYKPNKEKEYDVKFPWELSRLSFLITVARAYLISNEEKYIDFVYSTLKNWKDQNPIAYSVNWYPMEVAVRTVNLIQLRELLLVAPKADKTINLLNEVLLLQGVFLWRTVEYTDVRGNHYAANLTALHLLGKVFKNFYKEAKQWYNYAIAKTEEEFHLQFLKDGVNFEKSIPYHRLVVELFFASFLVMKRSGIKLKPVTLTIFKKASNFIKGVTKPNLLTPIIGDNDSASVFQNDNVTLNNHSNMLQLASLFLEDENLNISDEVFYSSVECFGINSVKSNIEKVFQFNYFKKGGFISAKTNTDYFITDYGEVGMNGKGGHGHNDLFSFELMLDNQDIIVDPGCYTYTGNLELKSEMKSSLYHNSLVVDNKEIAPQIGEWGISNIAQPEYITCDEKEDIVIISGEHNGYKRLEKPVKHKRTFSVAKDFSIILCEDEVYCNTKHEITRSLHFAENTDLEIKNNGIVVNVQNKEYLITFDKTTTVAISNYYLSQNYGAKIKVKKAVLKTNITKDSSLFFNIKKTINEQT